MNRTWGSTPINWGQIDYSQDRRGEIMGGAIARTGSMLGNAILEYSKEREEKEKKKKEEEAAAQFLTQQGYFKTPEEAKTAVKGIGGPEKVMQFMQLDQQKKLMEERAAALAQEKAAAEAKAAALERENAIVRNTVLGGAAPGQPPPFLARNGTPAADMSANGFARNMVMQGMPGAQALKYGEQIASGMPKQEQKVEVIDLPGGRKGVKGSVQILAKDEPKEEFKLQPVTDIPGLTVPHFRDNKGKLYKTRNGELVPVSSGPEDMDIRQMLANALIGATQAQGNAPAISEEDKQALDFIQKNPDDPRTPAIRQRLQAKNLLK